MSDIKGSKCGIYSALIGDNSDLVKEIANLYFKDGFKIADVTYGKGVFWKKINLSKYDFYPSDIRTCPESNYDFRKLPYGDGEFDILVLDPPYAHNPGKMLINDSYLNKETTKGFYHKDIIQLYIEGMAEGLRVLKNNGLMLIKCQDEIETSKQKISHIEIYDYAFRLKMDVEDLFILVQNKYPYIQHKEQKHARKNHSYMWIFKKT